MRKFLQVVYAEHHFEHRDREQTSAADRIKMWADGIVLLIALLSIVQFTYEEYTGDSAAWLSVTAIFFDLFFLVDYCLRFYFSGLRTDGTGTKWNIHIAGNNYGRRWYGWIDLLATLPPLLFHVLHVGNVFEEYSRAARILRALRLARVLRVMRAVRWFRELESARGNLQKHHRRIRSEMSLAFIAIGLCLVIGAVGLYLSEGNDVVSLNDIGNSLYWSFLSAVGQGSPLDLHSMTGRTFGVFVIISGMAFIGIITGAFTTFLMEKVRVHATGRLPFHHRGHLVICGYSTALPELLRGLARKNEQRRVILLFDRGNDSESIIEDADYRCMELGNRLALHWVRGNPVVTEDLRRANAAEASQIIILSDEGKDIAPQAINAHTMMTVMCVEHMHKEPAKHRYISTVSPFYVLEFLGDKKTDEWYTSITQKAASVHSDIRLVRILVHLTKHATSNAPTSKRVLIVGTNARLELLQAELEREGITNVTSMPDPLQLRDDSAVNTRFDTIIILADDHTFGISESDVEAGTFMTYQHAHSTWLAAEGKIIVETLRTETMQEIIAPALNLQLQREIDTYSILKSKTGDTFVVEVDSTLAEMILGNLELRS